MSVEGMRVDQQVLDLGHRVQALESERMIQKSQVDKVEHMKTMFLDILAMCEEFETRVTLLENKTKEGKEESTSAKAERSNIWNAMSKMKSNKDALETTAQANNKIIQLEAQAKLSQDGLLDVKTENTKIWHALTQNLATDSIQLEATQNLATDTKHLMSAVHARTTKLESQSKSMKERIEKLEGCDNENGVLTIEQKTTEDDKLAKSVSQLKIESELKKLEAISGRLHAPHMKVSCPPTSSPGVALHPVQYSGVPIYQGSYPHGRMPTLPLYPLPFMMPQSTIPTLSLPPQPPYTSVQHQAPSPGLPQGQAWHQSPAPGAFGQASSTEVSPPSTTSAPSPAPPEATSVDVLRPQEYRMVVGREGEVLNWIRQHSGCSIVIREHRVVPHIIKEYGITYSGSRRAVELAQDLVNNVRQGQGCLELLAKAKEKQQTTIT